MFNAAEHDAKTAAAFDSPQVGDYFHEHYTFWLYVVGVTDTHVDTLEAVGPCELPKDGKYKRQTLAEFRSRFAYGGSVPGYWVTLKGRGRDVTGWTKGKRTDVTSAATHLARLATLERHLQDHADNSLRKVSQSHGSVVPEDVSEYDRFAESVRWAIDRERARS